MDIGTAKPTRAQRKQVPHHLVDVATPEKPWNLARYLRNAKDTISEVHERGRLPFLVGGTGQYIRGLLEGWKPPPGPKDKHLRRDLERFAQVHGSEALYRRLAEIDPESARKLDHRNVRRVVRALEIHQLTGKRPSELRRKSPPPYDTLQLGLSRPREELYERIDRRIEHMLEHGLVAEVRALLERGVRPDTPAFSAIGYRQIAEHLLGRITLEEAVLEIQRATRQFVRRQANWFKEKDPEIEWFQACEGVVEELESRIEAWLEVGRARSDPEEDAW